MIPLLSKTNVNPATPEYPYGSTKDNPGDGSGTPVNTRLVGDLCQLAEKLMDESGIAPNGLPDNDTNGWQLYDALIAVTNRFNAWRGVVETVGAAGNVVRTFDAGLPIDSVNVGSNTNQMRIILGNGSWTGKTIDDFNINASLESARSSSVAQPIIYTVAYGMQTGYLVVQIDFYNSTTGAVYDLASPSKTTRVKLDVMMK